MSEEPIMDLVPLTVPGMPHASAARSLAVPGPYLGGASGQVRVEPEAEEREILLEPTADRAGDEPDIRLDTGELVADLVAAAVLAGVFEGGLFPSP
jgi:hypothetical protein